MYEFTFIRKDGVPVTFGPSKTAYEAAGLFYGTYRYVPANPVASAPLSPPALLLSGEGPTLASHDHDRYMRQYGW